MSNEMQLFKLVMRNREGRMHSLVTPPSRFNLEYVMNETTYPAAGTQYIFGFEYPSWEYALYDFLHNNKSAVRSSAVEQWGENLVLLLCDGEKAEYVGKSSVILYSIVAFWNMRYGNPEDHYARINMRRWGWEVSKSITPIEIVKEMEVEKWLEKATECMS